MSNLQQSISSQKMKFTIRYLLQFVGVYILSLAFLAVMLEGIRIPSETAFGVAFFLTFAFYLAYGIGYQACKKSISNKIDKALIDKGISKETVEVITKNRELDEGLIAKIIADNAIKNWSK